MTALFFLVFLLLILAELAKGLSANGTPPVLQKFSWQLDLAHFMWSNIRLIRVLLLAVLLLVAVGVPAEQRVIVAAGTVLLGLLWGGTYLLFNRFWVGKYKFLPITRKEFVKARDNRVDPELQVLGINLDGHQKAFPVNMLFYHHQIADEIAGKPVWVTYCGLCRAGRVYDIALDGQALDFSLVGAITFNAVFRDNQTGSWWRQETGEAVKGPMNGRKLDDLPFEQMSLENWLAKHPDSLILQYDPAFQGKYDFLAKLLNYEASLPGWHRQETPPLVIGVEIGKHARAYDLEELKKRRLVMDEMADVPLLVLSDESGSSAFVYDRRVGGEALEFQFSNGEIRDRKTGSLWNMFGTCTDGKLADARLHRFQSYQQFLRAWIAFHGHTSFFQFRSAGSA